MQELRRIGKRFWYMTPVSETDRPILGAVAGDEKTLMIDAGNSGAHARYFLEELKQQGVRPPQLVALTHWHWDHIFGLAHMPETVSIAAAETKAAMEQLLPLSWTDEALAERVAEGTEIEFCAAAIRAEFSKERDIQIVLPTLTFTGRAELDLGGVTCVLQHVGGDHAADSVVIYVPEEKLLFVGDCLYANIFAPKTHYTVAGTRALLEQLEAFDAEVYVLSHWKALTRAEFQAEADMLRLAGQLTEQYGGRQPEIEQAYVRHVGRELTEDEQEVISYFVNGYV